ncbi:MAG: ATP-binding protein [bacterium]|nr:ATP-binding protein [bacterium]
MQEHKIISQIDVAPNGVVNQTTLMRAFENFKEASSRLEERYESLRIEAEFLKKELQKKELEVRRAERMAVLGQTAAALAHEVRNPLGAIRLFSSLLREDIQSMPKSLELVDEIDRSISSLDGVVSNILQFAKETEIALSPVNLNSLLYDQVSYFKKMDREGKINFTLKLCEHAFVIGNAKLLGQVFYNLFLNSAQAMGFKGEIIIKTNLLSNEKENSLILLLNDSGPGIPVELLPCLFEPFVTGREEGTGLGLAIVKKILDQHKASICVENNDGAEFKIKFSIGFNEMRL